ncbi:MAG: sigma-70 family RNA polymerase sigma factor [Anaeromyxobacteraceae bacterium]
MNVDDRVRALLAGGDLAGAATAVIQAFTPVALSYLRPMLRDEEDVKDALSIWAENAWRGLPRFEWRSSLKTWCVRLACNVGLNFKGRAHHKRVRRFEPGEASALAEDFRTASALRVERQRRGILALREELTPSEQTLLFLRADQELPWEEVASILSEVGPAVTPTTLAKRFERLKERLGQLARERGLID